MIYTYAATAILSASVAFAGAWKIQNWRFDAKEKDHAEQVVIQERENRGIERKRDTNVIDAQNKSADREHALRLAADSARTERDGLRDDLNAIRASLPGLAIDACRERASTLAGLFDQCAAAYSGMAEKASGHASDTLTLEQAWPK